MGLLHNGVWLPDGESHLQKVMDKYPPVDGKPSYQYKKYEAALEYAKDRRVALDIGAHVGLWSMHMVDDFDFVHAFEPMDEFRDLYKKNVHAANYNLHPVACSFREDMVFLSTDDTSSGNTYIDDKSQLAAWAVTIDSYGFSDVDFIKVDCEGYEYFVLLGARETILRNKPVICVEQKKDFASKRYGISNQEAVKFLEELGMKLKREIVGDYILAWE